MLCGVRDLSCCCPVPWISSTRARVAINQVANLSGVNRHLTGRNHFGCANICQGHVKCQWGGGGTST